MIWPRAVAGRPLPLVTAPAPELADGSLCARGPRLPGLTMVAQKGREQGKFWQVWPIVGGVGNGVRRRFQAGI